MSHTVVTIVMFTWLYMWHLVNLVHNCLKALLYMGHSDGSLKSYMHTCTAQ